MPRETVPLAERCNNAANAAVAPAECCVAVLSRSPLAVEVRNVPGRAPLTAAQVAQAKAAAEAVDPRNRQPKSLSALRTEIEAWFDAVPPNPQKLKQAVALALAMLAQQRPRALREHGVPVDGDEIA